MPSYNPRVIEPRWQAIWAERQTFRTPEPDDPAVIGKPKYYVLDMFPYPSGSGLHVGHPEGYTATDILARFKRMKGFHVLHPMGWDAFGLPAEQYAIQTGTHPRITTRKNIATFRRQIDSIGFSYDWEREVDTTDPNYVKWTQWIFLELFDTWYDSDANKGRRISELPIPAEVAAQGDEAIRTYRDSKRLAYQAYQPVNWCPELGTVLANEEVIDGKSERGGHPVIRLPLRQWNLRITAYAQRLMDDLEPLDWPESIKKMQRDWIGRSDGAEVDFRTADGSATIRVFTTRPDTLFGATYMVLAPEYALVEQITTAEQRPAVEAYREATARKSDFERTETAKKKTGVFTGAYALNPVNGKPIPIWIADYVLAGYGTGAIMAVPAHDERDFAFATQFGLPITIVVQPPPTWLSKTGSTLEKLTEAYCEAGTAVNSGLLDGLETAQAKEKMIQWLESHGVGKRKVNFKLRDWLFSRQRYWGEPFPILHGPNGEVVPLTLEELPLHLPELEDFKPTGSPDGPLAKATDWGTLERDGISYRRETNTMPQWAGSCWYYLRYIDPKNEGSFCAPAKAKYWLPVDLYVGGAEHAVLHLLYARFWHKVLFDRGHVPCPEPFQRLVNQGMILGEYEYHITPEQYTAKREILERAGILPVHRKGDEETKTKESYVLRVKAVDGEKLINLPDELVEKRQGKMVIKGTDVELTPRADKMSKSRGNVVNPDDIIKEYGADSLRLYEMFMGPLEAVKPWSTKSVEGVYRFLGRVWRLIVDEFAELPTLSPSVQDVEPDTETLRLLHRTIQKVSEDTEELRFNTAIAALMEFSNHVGKLTVKPKSVLTTFVQLLSPYAPHIAEELWAILGRSDNLTYAPWPVYDPALTKADEIEVPVQINGKVKLKLTVTPSIDNATLESLAREKAADQIAGRTIRKVIVVPGKMVNFVVA